MQWIQTISEYLRDKIAGFQEGWNRLLSNGSLYWIGLLAMAVLLLLYLLWKHLSYLRVKSRYSTRKRENSIAVWLAQWFRNYKCTRILTEHLVRKISIYNSFDYEKNYRLSSALLAAIGLLTLAYGTVTLISGLYVWYMALSYFVLISFFFLLCFHIFSASAVIRFKKKLPRTLKILNSRYLSKGDILEAIYISLNDFEPLVRKEMKQVHDILQSNRREDMDKTFGLLESKYDEEHFTLMLNLIRHAYFKGEGQDESGKEIIKSQFEKTTESILDDLENKKDIQIFSRSYIIFAIFLPALSWGGKKFNQLSLGETASDYFRSQIGTQLELLFLFMLVLFILYILYLERASS